MLMLTRSVNQKIGIGDDISVTVFEVNGNQERIGIDAPKSVAVHRSEIYEKIHGEKQQTNTAKKSDLYDSLVAKLEKSKTTKKTIITVKKRRQVAI